jgi:transcriptional regulator with XRE-family HTH domain
VVINDPHRSTLPDGPQPDLHNDSGTTAARSAGIPQPHPVPGGGPARAALLGYQVLGRNAVRVSQRERGKHLPDLRTLSRYATAFDTTVSEILRGVL